MNNQSTQTFIELAIEGGWAYSKHWSRAQDLHFLLTDVERPDFEKILLDPLAWQAVGKVKGWYDSKELIPESWLMKQVGMVLALAEGKTIEEYLATIV